MARGADKGMTARRIAIAHDGYEQTLPAEDRALLDALLELRARVVRPAAPLAEAVRPARLYKATQPPRVAPLTMPSQRPAARLEEIKRAPLSRDDLSDDVSRFLVMNHSKHPPAGSVRNICSNRTAVSLSFFLTITKH